MTVDAPELPTTITFTARQKHALELVEVRGLSFSEAAREMGFHDPEGNGRVSFAQLLERAKRARAWRNRMIEEYLEPR